jgi:hypothetical protein
MERKVRIVRMNEAGSDREYWLSRPVAERLLAIEMLRLQYMKATHAEQRLQRVCRVARVGEK